MKTVIQLKNVFVLNRSYFPMQFNRWLLYLTRWNDYKFHLLIRIAKYSSRVQCEIVVSKIVLLRRMMLNLFFLIQITKHFRNISVKLCKHYGLIQAFKPVSYVPVNINWTIQLHSKNSWFLIFVDIFLCRLVIWIRSIDWYKSIIFRLNKMFFEHVWKQLASLKRRLHWKNIVFELLTLVDNEVKEKNGSTVSRV